VLRQNVKQKIKTVKDEQEDTRTIFSNTQHFLAAVCKPSWSLARLSEFSFLTFKHAVNFYVFQTAAQKLYQV
jgi:hypothetical protein